MTLVFAFLISFVVAVSVVVSVVSAAYSEQCDTLQVHLFAHSHDDPGWLKTVDQYYYGSNSTIYEASVSLVYDTVVSSLLDNHDRKYVAVEMSFFQRWYFEQTLLKRQQVKMLVKSGQLSFVNGGWVMHDEAGSHYASMIDQTTLGHRFLKDEFDYKPKVGWQIDPFGHSNTHASLMSSDVGFDSLFFGRIDFQDMIYRKGNRTLEFIWRGSKSQPQSEVFTGVFSDGNYGYPTGLCWDETCWEPNPDPIMDDPRLADYNVDSYVNKFANAAIAEQGWANGCHVSLRMGTDFHYRNAHKWFKNLDKLIKYVNEKDQRFNVFYSNPQQYTEARAKEQLTWTEKTDDFFPYADCQHCYWGGYFTSRPTLKYMERISSSYLQTLKQSSASNLLRFQKGKPDAKYMRGLKQESTLAAAAASPLAIDLTQSLFDLTAAVGLVNHHDAITGTAKQHVVDDYTERLDRALSEAEDVVARVVSSATFGGILSGDSLLASADASVGADIELFPKMTVCRMANQTECSLTQSLVAGEEALIVAYNPLPRSSSQQLSVILSANVIDQDGIAVEVFFIAGNKSFDPVHSEMFHPAGKSDVYNLVFAASLVPAMSSSNYVVRISKRDRLDVSGPFVAKVLEEKVHSVEDGPLIITNGQIIVKFDQETGLMETVTRKMSDGKLLHQKVSNSLKYYMAYGVENGLQAVRDERDPHVQNAGPSHDLKGTTSTQPSGAYIFRTASEASPLLDISNGRVVLTVVRGRDITEVRQTFGTWASQVVRLRNGQETVETDWTVGPVPIDDMKGKEIHAVFKSDLKSDNTMYTDSNGREFMERVKNYRPTWDLQVTEPIAGNQYPITAAAYIKDKNAVLSILSDRSQAVMSLENGQLEFLVQRRLTVDDRRGVNEPLDETTGGIDYTNFPNVVRVGDGIIVSGRHHILLSSADNGVKETREWMDKLFLPIVPFYAKSSTAELLLRSPAVMKSIISQELPVNLHLLTVERWSINTLLVRLSHQFAVGEDAELSKPVTVNLASLFSKFNIAAATEVSLSANQDRLTMLQNKVIWNTPNRAQVEAGLKTSMDVLLTDLQTDVIINPMEIRTFMLQLA